MGKLVKTSKILVFTLAIFLLNFNGNKFLDLEIESQNADLLTDKATIIFYNNVYIKYKDLEIKADKATVFLEKKLKSIDKILIENNVKIISNNSEISANNIIIQPNANKIIFSGNIKTKIKYNSN